MEVSESVSLTAGEQGGRRYSKRRLERANAAGGNEGKEVVAGPSEKRKRRRKEEIQSNKVTSTEDETLEEVDPRLLAICKNTLIAEKIASYLSLDEMKAASEVNVDFCQMIRGTFRFQNSAVLVISKNAKRLGTMLKKSDFPWRGARIDMSIQAKVLDGPNIQRVLESCEFVSLVPMCELRGGNANSKILNMFLNVLKSSPRLTHLQMDVRFLQRKFSQELPPEEIMSALQNLKRLDFLEWNHKNSTFFKDNIRSVVPRLKSDPLPPLLAKEEPDVEGQQPKLRNFLQLTHSAKSLQSFRIADIATKSGAEIELLKYISPILANNAASLVELSVHRGHWALDEAKRTVVFPCLKRLTATTEGVGKLSSLINFLRQHKSLEELDLKLKGNVDNEMCEAVKEVSPRLKKLHLTFKDVASPFAGGGPINWSFLESMTKLKDFSLSRPLTRRNDSDFDFGTGPRILACLPKNQLEKLSFKGIGGNGFWIDEYPVEHDLQSKMEMLEGFTCVKRLSLLRCRNFVDDELLQFIIRRFTKLEELEISHCTLTHKGFTGRGLHVDGDEEVSGVSISSLKGLRHLAVRGCVSLVREEFLSSLELPSLKTFDYIDRPRSVPEASVVSFVMRHPQLKTIAVNLDDPKSHLQVMNNLKAFDHGLRRVVNLNGRWLRVDSDSEAENEIENRYRPIRRYRMFGFGGFGGLLLRHFFDDSDEYMSDDDGDEDADIW